MGFLTNILKKVCFTKAVFFWLGTICGLATLAITNLTGISLKEAQYYNYKWSNFRQSAVEENFRRFQQKEDTQLMKEHDKKDNLVDLDKLNIVSNVEK